MQWLAGIHRVQDHLVSYQHLQPQQIMVKALSMTISELQQSPPSEYTLESMSQGVPQAAVNKMKMFTSNKLFSMFVSFSFHFHFPHTYTREMKGNKKEKTSCPIYVLCIKQTNISVYSTRGSKTQAGGAATADTWKDLCLRREQHQTTQQHIFISKESSPVCSSDLHL